MAQVLFQQEHVSSSKQEPCGVRMPKEMWVETFHSGGYGKTVHQGFDGLDSQWVTIYGQEERFDPLVRRLHPVPVEIIKE